MNVALIFAGGVGQRMNSRQKPKQFLELHGKPILIYTLENFENDSHIDEIVLVSHKDYINLCGDFVNKYNLNKVKAIVAGGKNGQSSIYNGLCKIKELYDNNPVVLIHDGVRPILNKDIVGKCIENVKKFKSAITVSPLNESLLFSDLKSKKIKMFDRKNFFFARAPQCFYLEDILKFHKKAIKENKFDFVDSASLMDYYGFKLNIVEGNISNIKITTPLDFFVFKAMLEAEENYQIIGF